MSSTPRSVGIIGAGAVAQALGRLLLERGTPVVALASRTRARAEQAAAFIGRPVTAVECAELPALASRILIAVSDHAITTVAGDLARAGMREGVALHTCGSLGPAALEPLRAAGVACGVLHPLQTIATPEQGVSSLIGITFGVGGDDAAREWAEELVSLLDGRPLRIRSSGFPAYHAGAVMAGNGVIALLDAAVALMAQAGVDARSAVQALAPLVHQGLDNVVDFGPPAALTGPIGRGDVVPVRAHIEATAAAPAHVAALYRAVSHYLVELARVRGIPESTLRTLTEVLDASTPGERHGFTPRSSST